jgi:hypothetical protein
LPTLTNFIGNYKESRQSAGILQRRNIMKQFIVKDKDGKDIIVEFDNEIFDKAIKMVEELREEYKRLYGCDVECI